jgi:hypothetical protein
MFSKLHGYLRIIEGNGFVRACTRAMCIFSVVLLLAVAASAYTVVMLGGRHVEIPDRFTVTPLALTYEAAPGINITILMSSIDIAATERANNEPAGALLKRAARQEPQKRVSGQTRRPRRELTAVEIEAARRARQRSEQEYERRRIELGLPSVEESRRRNEEETRRLRELSLQSEAERAQSETYWRSRASQLRTEIASLSAQISYTRARLAELPEDGALYPNTYITGVVPRFPLHRARTRFPVVFGNPGFMRGDSPVIPGAGFLAFGSGSTQGRVQLNAGVRFGNYGRRVINRHGIIAPGGIFFGTSYPGSDYSSERANLVNRLHELESERAGLQARWRALEEEARRAGAPPGWLRP